MGKAVGKLLAEKGANVIIVARDAAKLEEALKYISVCTREHCTARTFAEMLLQGSRFKTLVPTLPLYQRRPD